MRADLARKAAWISTKIWRKRILSQLKIKRKFSLAALHKTLARSPSVRRYESDLTTADFARLVRPGGLIADVKGMWCGVTLPEGLKRWQL